MVTTKMFSLGRNGGLEEMKDSSLALNQIFFLNGYGQSPEHHQRLAIYKIDEAGTFGTTYHYVNLDKPVKGREQSNEIRPVAELFGIGMYFHPDQFATPEEIDAALILANEAEEKKSKAAEEAKVIHEANIARGKELFAQHMPKDAKSIIIAEEEQNETDLHSDYFGSKTLRTVILAFSGHTKNLFSEMRKAADKFEPTQHLGTNKGLFKVIPINNENHNDHRNYKDSETRGYQFNGFDAENKFDTKQAAEDYIATLSAPPVYTIDGIDYTFRWGIDETTIEHKENYTGGAGYYLGLNRYSGWKVSKTTYYMNSDSIYAAAGMEGGFLADTPAAVAEPKPHGNYEPQQVAAGEIQLIDYSEKAIAIIGDTKPIKDKLSAMGGRWNSRLSCGAGWIFSKKKLPELQAAFGA